MVVNPGKNEMIEVEEKRYRRLCIKTHVITDADNITDVVMKYAAPEMQERRYPVYHRKRRWPAPKSGQSP
ncbi:MAG: hypothetical protein ACLTY5_05940 [Angelakisella sp.]